MNEPDDKIVSHLNAFSTRAIQVVFAARYNAGQRGGKLIEAGDLLLGLLLEDNGLVGNLLSQINEERAPILPPPSHIPFFPSEVANDLMTRIEKLLPQSEPIPHTIDLPLSPDIEHVFDGAKAVQGTFHHKQIQPLHFLAAVLTQESGQYTTLLNQVGITKELVLERLNVSES